MTDWVEVLRTGTHTASSGALVAVDDAKLAAIARNYDPKYFASPLVVGHPKENAPAYGWVDGLRAEGGKLLARFSQVHEGLREAVRDGRFRNRSVSLYGDLEGRGPYLRHVGLLGATPPAVKGMEAIKFAEGDEITLDFKEQEEEMDKETVKGWFDEAFSSFSERLKGLLSKPPAAAGDDLQAKIDAAVAAAQTSFAEKAEAREAALQAKVTAVEAQLAEQSKQTAGAGVASFVERMRAEGHWAPAWDEAGAVEFMQALGDAETFEFTEGEGEAEKTVNKAPLAFFQSFIEGLPKVVDFGELTGGTGQVKGGKLIKFSEPKHGEQVDGLELAERAAQIEGEKKISYSEALGLARAELQQQAG